MSNLAKRVEALEAAVARIGHNGGPPLDNPTPHPKREAETKPVLIADARVAERYNVSTRTLTRWDQIPDLGFPPPVYIRDRRYRELAKLESWDRANARRAAAQAKQRGPAGRFATDHNEAT